MHYYRELLKEECKLISLNLDIYFISNKVTIIILTKRFPINIRNILWHVSRLLQFLLTPVVTIYITKGHICLFARGIVKITFYLFCQHK